MLYSDFKPAARKTDALTEQTSSGRKPTAAARWCAPATEQRASNAKPSLKVSGRRSRKEPGLLSAHENKSEVGSDGGASS